jgi:spore maturation protein CgeB
VVGAGPREDLEAGACGTPIISDPWEGLETLFAPGHEIVLAESPDQVLAALAMTETDRDAQAQAARARILDGHTAAHRAAELETHLIAAAAAKEPAQGAFA